MPANRIGLIKNGTTQTANNSSAIQFTGLDSSRTYMLVGSALTTSVNGNGICINVGTGSSPTWQTGSDYRYTATALSTRSTSNVNNVSGGATYINTGLGLWATGVGAWFTFYINGPMIWGQMAAHVNDGGFNSDATVSIQGRYTGAGTVTAIEFTIPGANIPSGSVSIYQLVP